MLQENDIPMAICSGALLTEIEMILRQSNLPDLFGVIVSADHVSKGKPDPEGYIKTLKRMNENSQNEILPGECVVIEDSHWGLEAAKAAGMNSIAVTNTYSKNCLQGYADLVTDRLDSLSIDDVKSLCVD